VTPPVHLLALSSLLAHDPDAGQLHTQHLRMLAMLCNDPQAMTLNDCINRLDLSPSQGSRLAKRLVARRLLRKRRDEPNGRHVLLIPTAAGRALDERVRGHVEACRLQAA
jgi:DNA-binding MarR family transcriptional regulator